MRINDEEYIMKITGPARRRDGKAGEITYSENAIEDNVAYIYFDKAGNECGEESGVAKFNNHGLYFIKYAIEGRDRGSVFNPYSIYFRDGDDTRRKSMYEYKKIKKEGFDLYLEFLRTRNSSYRMKLERGQYEIS